MVNYWFAEKHAGELREQGVWLQLWASQFEFLDYLCTNFPFTANDILQREQLQVSTMILQLPFLFKRLFAQAADDGIPSEVKVLLLLFNVLFHGCPFEIRFTLLPYSILSRDHGVHVL